MQDLQIEYVPLDSIKPYKRNAKLHPQEQIEQIKASMREFGNIDPIGIWHNEIVEGHGRYIAARELGYSAIPIIRLDQLTDEQRKAYALVHNKLTMNSGFDLELLGLELDEIMLDMEKYGFFDYSEYEPEPEQLDAEDPEESDRTVVRLVFNSYKEYHAQEQNIKAFANSIGCAYTIGK